MRRAPRVLFIAEDAGGAAALAPVFRALRKRAPGSALSVFGDGAKDAALTTLFRRFRPDTVVTAPGPWGLNADKRAIGLAKRSGVPTAAVVDFWANYAGRFSRPGTRDLAFLPDAVCAIDATCRRGLIRNGVDPKRIVVTGNPHFESFKARAGKGSEIVFFHQPFSELKRKDARFDWGYDERGVLADLLRALDDIGDARRFVIRLHPRTERPEAFERFLGRGGRNVRIDRTAPAPSLLRRAALATGMNSMALFEAALAGVPVLSYQPGLKRPDALMSNRLGLSVLVTDRRRLKPVLRRLLASRPPAKNRRIRERYVNGHATRRVLHVIDSLV